MDYVRNLFSRYRDKGILIDANLLLLYFVGRFDPNLISKFKRTAKFTVDDFRRLLFVLKQFNKVVTTPNILTEVSNLSNQLAANLKPDFYTEFARQVSTFQENYISSVNICAQDHFIKFGLTDSGIIESAAHDYLIFTDDFKLANYLETKNIDVINFNHIRFLKPTR